MSATTNIPAQRVVSHPDGDGFALLDVYGDYYRSQHGSVWKFGTEKAASKLLGLFDKNDPII